MRRVVDLRMEIEVFLQEKGHRLVGLFSNKYWVLKVCFLSDLFGAINELNTSMQGRKTDILALSEKLSAFKAKLRLWKSKVERGRLASFASLNELVENFKEEEENLELDELKAVVVDHLDALITDFDRYIPDQDIATSQWIRDPFNANVEDLSDDIPGLQEELLELQAEEFSRQNFKTSTLTEFWTAVKKDKKAIGAAAMRVLIQFSTTYLCEQGFSALTAIKTKQRNRLQPEEDMRVCLSTVVPDIANIVENKQQYHLAH